MPTQVLPFSPATFMHVIGSVEIAVGAVILTGYTRLGGYVAAIRLSGIGSTRRRPATTSTSRCGTW
jgi:hypothetical protein